MKHIGEVTKEVQKRVNKILAGSKTQDLTSTRDYSEKEDKCPDCNGMGYLVAEDGWTVLLGADDRPLECHCQKKKNVQQRMRAAMIPDEFFDARLDSYERSNHTQEALYTAIITYLKEIDQFMKLKPSKRPKQNSIGFVAEIGEQRFKQIHNFEEQQAAKMKYNSFGLGKTHLQIAAAKEMIKRGYSVLVVSDVLLMEELMQAKMADDRSASFFKLLGQVINAEILVWDDIGKSNPTEARKSAYFTIINERYKARRPIIYSSNECTATLPDRIGDGAFSRLMGMSRGHIYRVKGPDYRIGGNL